jgi:hypothetical protein
MKYLEQKVVNLDAKKYVRRHALAKDCKHHITEPTTIVDEHGKPLLIYDVARDEKLTNARNALKRLKYLKDVRGIARTGMLTNARVFGYAPRDGRRRQPCRAATSHETDKAEADALVSCAKFIDDWYKHRLPQEYTNHTASIEDISDDWRIGETVFTSGIANYNNTIQYHYDRGNFTDCMSIMIGFRQHAKGGFLCIPELETSLLIGDYSITAFDGQSLFHGVTPIWIAPNGFRATAVYYSLRRMWRCEPIGKEIARHRKQMTESAINPFWKRTQKKDSND